MADVLQARTENIRVIARFRPINDREKKEWSKYSSTKWDGKQQVPATKQGVTVSIDNDTNRPYRFSFDDVLWTESTQERVFETVGAPVCRGALVGFNGTVFAYGQTASGKTHTVIGPEDKFDAKESGIVPRAANFFFHAIENSPDIDTAELRVSFLEVYRGELRDLAPNTKKGLLPLKIRQKLSGETYVENLNLAPVTSLKEMLKLIRIANSHRTMAATSMNRTSSRSHSIMTFYLKIRKTPEVGGHKLKAKVNFCDLAGSEKVKKTGAKGQRMKEAQSINVGLSTLARVIEALVKQRRSVPFRDSMLTHILKDSLVGNTKTTLIVACSPHQFNIDETITSCRFASRCKLIKTRVISNKELTPSQMKALIKKLRNDNMRLKDRLNIHSSIAYTDEERAALKHASSNRNVDLLGLGVGVNTDETKEDMWQYKLQADARFKTISKLEEEREEIQKEKEELEQKLIEAQDQQGISDDYEQNIEDLEIEIERLKKELNESEDDKKQLAIANALLASRLDNNNDQNEIIDQLQNQKDNLKSQRKDLLNELRDLKFSSNEAQKIYSTVFKEINSISDQLEDTNNELEEYKEINTEQENALEDKNRQIQKLKTEIKAMSKNRRYDDYDDGKDSESYDDDDDYYSDEDGYDDETGDMARPGGIHTTGFVLRSDDKKLISDQEKYLLQVADKTTHEWQENEERAWKDFLYDVAKEEGYRDGKDMLKKRRQRAKESLKQGKIDEMPTDSELMEDIREEFELRYDPATNTLRSIEEVEENVQQSEMLIDENEIDDPITWDLNEVEDWLTVINLPKYREKFQREGIDGRILLVDLTPQTLKRDLGVKGVHVEKMMRSIKELRERSPGYEHYLISQGLVDEVKAKPIILDDNGVFEEHVDFEDNGDKNFGDDEDDSKWELNDEDKNFGEQFWRLDDLFKILDIRKQNKLNLGDFKHGLHALNVNIEDNIMDDVFREIAGTDAVNGYIDYDGFIEYFQFTDRLTIQRRKYAMSILSALPRVANNRRQYVVRASMVIKYAIKYNNSRNDINNYLYNKGLTKAEIDAAWKQFRFNPKKIGDINFRGISMKKGKLIDMSLRDQNVKSFDDYQLLKLLKRCGNRGSFGSGSKEFTDLDYLRASGKKCKISDIKFWYDPDSLYFNGFQVSYKCTNNEIIKGPKNFILIGNPMEEELIFENDEFITSIKIYFEHFICGIGIETNISKERVFGYPKTLEKYQFDLIAPQGSAIMAFYGSIGRLFESLGVYCVRLDDGQYGLSPIRTRRKKSKHGRSRSRNKNSTQTSPNPNSATPGGNGDGEESMMSRIRQSMGGKSPAAKSPKT